MDLWIKVIDVKSIYQVRVKISTSNVNMDNHIKNVRGARGLTHSVLSLSGLSRGARVVPEEGVEPTRY